MDDDRGIPFLNYSNRMAKAYNETIHFKTREKTNPKKSFEEALEFAKVLNADVITLVGDIFSFPSEKKAKDWYADEEYQALSKHRWAGTETRFLTMIHGLPPRA